MGLDRRPASKPEGCHVGMMHSASPMVAQQPTLSDRSSPDFHSLKEAQVVIGAWKDHYNRVRPHSALGYRPPAPVTLKALATHLPSPPTMQ